MLEGTESTGAREALVERIAEAIHQSACGIDDCDVCIRYPEAQDAARAVLPLVDAEVSAAVEASRAEVARALQGLWDAWQALGHDTDGDTGPGAWIAGSGVESFIASVVRDAATFRQQAEEDYDADTDALIARAESAEADRDRLREGIETLADEWWNDAEYGPTTASVRRLMQGMVNEVRALLTPSGQPEPEDAPAEVDCENELWEALTVCCGDVNDRCIGCPDLHPTPVSSGEDAQTSGDETEAGARPWLPVEFAGYDSTDHPLFRLNGGRTQHGFSREDVRDAFLGLLPAPVVAPSGEPTHTLTEYGTTRCPVERVGANADDEDGVLTCSACGGVVTPSAEGSE